MPDLINTSLQTELPKPKDLVKDYEKSPGREKRKLMGLEVHVDTVMALDAPSDKTVLLKVWLDDSKGICERQAASCEGKIIKFAADSTLSFLPKELGVEDFETFATIGFELFAKDGEDLASFGKVTVSISSGK